MNGFLLKRYFALQFINAMLMVFATVALLVYLLDFVELMRRTGDARSASVWSLAQLAMYRTPSVIEQILPFAVLFGAMATLLNLSRKLELVIGRAGGMSVWQILHAPVAVAALLGLFSVMVFNPVSARLKDKATTIEFELFGQGARNLGKDNWLRQRSVDGAAIIRAGGVSRTGADMTEVTFFVFDRDNRFVERVEARSATMQDGFWLLRNARVSSADNAPESYEEYQIATNLRATQVRDSFRSADSVAFWQLPRHIERTEFAGLGASRYRLQYQSLLARPFLLIAMVIIASTVSLRFFRMGGVSRFILYGIVAGFMLYVVKEIVEDLGANGFISAFVAAWTPAILGILFGSLALLHLEDG